ncbi:MAG TPA: hypothetical protein ENN81_02845 [Phycisphaerales bacterium]|nr:hypothetical protein [Phycisphaerales bacterium]
MTRCLVWCVLPATWLLACGACGGPLPAGVVERFEIDRGPWVWSLAAGDQRYTPDGYQTGAVWPVWNAGGIIGDFRAGRRLTGGQVLEVETSLGNEQRT